MNRNSRLFFLSGLGLVTLIFVITILFSMVWPAKEIWYMQNMSWLIPLIIVLFWAPVVPLILSNWDIHFGFEYKDSNLITTISNYGTTPFGFNRIRFASGRKYRIFGKREFLSQEGILTEAVKIYNADTSTVKVEGYRGCTLRKGLPVTLQILNHQVPKCLRNFKDNSRVYLSLYWKGNKQRVYSQRIQPEIIKSICETKD